MKSYYSIKAAVGSPEADVYIYDQVGSSWLSDGVEAKKFTQDLANLHATQINLRINSPGGSVFEGHAIYNALKRHPATVTSYVDGLAASIASVIALAGDKVVMARNALFMIHNPMGSVRDGTASDMRAAADVLDKISESVKGVYAEKTDMSTEDVQSAMDAETWYTAAEAQAAGFADEIGAPMEMAALADLDALMALGYHLPPGLVVAVAPEAAEPDDAPAQAQKGACDARGTLSPELFELVTVSKHRPPKEAAR